MQEDEKEAEDAEDEENEGEDEEDEDKRDHVSETASEEEEGIYEDDAMLAAQREQPAAEEELIGPGATVPVRFHAGLGEPMLPPRLPQLRPLFVRMEEVFDEVDMQPEAAGPVRVQEGFSSPGLQQLGPLAHSTPKLQGSEEEEEEEGVGNEVRLEVEAAWYGGMN